METSSVNPGYDPVQLSEALMAEFQATCHKISKELEKIGIKTDDRIKWLLSFSFAFSIRDQKTIPEVFRGLEFNPEFAEPFSVGSADFQSRNEKEINNPASAEEDSDFIRQARRTLAVFDEVPHLAGYAELLSKLGICVLSLELAKFMFSKREYSHFVMLLMFTREL